jgi:hypothetical protein
VFFTSQKFRFAFYVFRLPLKFLGFLSPCKYEQSCFFLNTVFEENQESQLSWSKSFGIKESKLDEWIRFGIAGCFGSSSLQHQTEQE